MADAREQLIRLLSQVQDFGIKRTPRLAHPKLPRNEEIADFLIANGVTVCNMNDPEFIDFMKEKL